jgi:hypothetical protein
VLADRLTHRLPLPACLLLLLLLLLLQPWGVRNHTAQLQRRTESNPASQATPANKINTLRQARSVCIEQDIALAALSLSRGKLM